MARRRTLTDKQIADLKPRSARYTVPDPDLRGLYVRVTPGGGRTFAAVARDPHGKQVWATLGTADILKIGEARERAREALKRIKAGRPPFEAPPAKPDTFGAVAKSFLVRHVEAKGLRSGREIRRILDVYVLPEWQDRPFASIRRSDVSKLLDTVEDRRGKRQADYVLAVVRKLFNWHATRDDRYVSPIVRGMRRTDAKGGTRDRILADDEIRTVWRYAEGAGNYGAIVRLLLLTAQRREKVGAMRWADVSDDGTWTIPTEAREKGNPGVLKLPAAALVIIRAQSHVEGNPYVFTGRTEGSWNGWSRAKRDLDDAILRAAREAAVKHGGDPADARGLREWTLHDLRRTARSLMSRAGVRPDIAERVLGHAIAGVAGVYDRHTYADERADALAKLAGLIESILNPPAGNVVKMVAAS